MQYANAQGDIAVTEFGIIKSVALPAAAIITVVLFLSYNIPSALDRVIKYNYVQMPSTSVSGDTFIVTGNSSINGCTVILALYETDIQGISQLVDYKTAVYNGTAIPFTTTAMDYTSAKVMVLKDLESAETVTEVEIVDLGL